MKKKTFILCMLLIGLLGLCSCGSPSSGFKGNTQNAVKEQVSHNEIPGLTFERSMKLKFAENFAVDYYKGGYTLLTTTRVTSQ